MYLINSTRKLETSRVINLIEWRFKFVKIKWIINDKTFKNIEVKI
jgi:hypothetical protein